MVLGRGEIVFPKFTFSFAVLKLQATSAVNIRAGLFHFFLIFLLYPCF